MQYLIYATDFCLACEISVMYPEFEINYNKLFFVKSVKLGIISPKLSMTEMRGCGRPSEVPLSSYAEHVIF